MIKRFITFKLFSLFIFLLSFPAFAEEKVINTFLWQVKGNSSDNVSYLYGTIHIPMKGKYKLPAEVYQAVENADIFVMETDLTKAVFQAQKYIYLEQEENLKEMMNPDSWKKLVEQTRQYGLPEPLLARMEPWFLNSLLLLAPKFEEAGEEKGEESAEESVMDSVLRKATEDLNKSVAFLETPEEQFSILDNMPEKVDIYMLEETLKAIESGEDSIATLEQAYINNDIKKLEEEILQADNLYSKIYLERLLDDRNNKWLPVIEELIAEEKAFVAVGLGHLIGENGLVQVLKNKGYTVQRIE